MICLAQIISQVIQDQAAAIQIPPLLGRSRINVKEAGLMPLRGKRKLKMLGTHLLKVMTVVLLCTLVSSGLAHLGVREENILMTYLIGVIVVNIQSKEYVWGILVSVLCILAFNFFFTEPVYTLMVYDPNYFVTFIIFLIISLIASNLTSKLQRQAEIAHRKEQQNQYLYKISSGFLNVSGLENIIHYGLKSLYLVQSRRCVLYLSLGEHQLSQPYMLPAEGPCLDSSQTERLTHWCFTSGKPCGRNTDCEGESPWQYRPIKSGSQVLGVVGLYYGIKPEGSWMDLPKNTEQNANLIVQDTPEEIKGKSQTEVSQREQQVLINTVISQLALALDRENLYCSQEDNRIKIEKEKLRNSLLRSVSHDLRTPLTAIAGSTSFMMDSYDSLNKSAMLSLLSDIGSDAAWLNNMVENLLNMTRIQDGQLLIKKENEVVDDIVQEACGRVFKQPKHRSLATEMPEEVLLVPMDAQLIVQVLVNLLDNAVKHTQEGCHVQLKVYRQDQTVVFQISDDGGGIPEAMLAKIFENFVSTKLDKADSFRGTGLGLGICKAIVEAHEGVIRAYNNEAGGATFEVKLPLGKVVTHKATKARITTKVTKATKSTKVMKAEAMAHE